MFICLPILDIYADVPKQRNKEVKKEFLISYD